MQQTIAIEEGRKKHKDVRHRTKCRNENEIFGFWPMRKYVNYSVNLYKFTPCCVKDVDEHNDDNGTNYERIFFVSNLY